MLKNAKFQFNLNCDLWSEKVNRSMKLQSTILWYSQPKGNINIYKSIEFKMTHKATANWWSFFTQSAR